MKRLIEVPPLLPGADRNSPTMSARLGLYTYTEIEALIASGAGARHLQERVAHWGLAEASCRGHELLFLAQDVAHNLNLMSEAIGNLWGKVAPVDISEVRAKRLLTLLGVE